MTTAALNGTEIAYVDSGGDGPPVVLSHGFLMDHRMFDAQVAALAPEFRVITWDERGFGGTIAPGPFDYWDSARDLLALLDHLGIERAVVGGMSQGGFISLRVALLAPERVRGLVLMDTQAGCEDPALVPSYDLMMATWQQEGPAAVQEIVAAIILGPGDWQEWFRTWADLPVDQVTYAYRCLMDRDDLSGRLGEIEVPALILHGTDDAAISMDKAEALRDGLAGPVELVPIPGGPHASNLTHAAAVNPPLLDFLRRLTAG